MTKWQVVDNDPFVIIPQEDAEFMVGERIPLEDGGSSNSIGIVNWAWSRSAGGNVMVVYGTSVTVVFDREGEYQVTLTVTDAAGNIDEATMRVVVSDVSSPISGILAVIVAVCIAAVVVSYILLSKRVQGD